MVMEHSHSAFSMPERVQGNRQQQFSSSAAGNGLMQRQSTGFTSYQNGEYGANVGHVQPQYQMQLEPGDYSSHNHSQRQNPPDNNWNGSQHNSAHSNLPNGDLGYPQSGLLSSFGSSTSVSAATAIANIASLINSSTSNNQLVGNNPNVQSTAPLAKSKTGILTNSAPNNYSPAVNHGVMSGNRQLHNSVKPLINGDDVRLNENGVQMPVNKQLRTQHLTVRSLGSIQV